MLVLLYAIYILAKLLPFFLSFLKPRRTARKTKRTGGLWGQGGGIASQSKKMDLCLSKFLFGERKLEHE